MSLRSRGSKVKAAPSRMAKQSAKPINRSISTPSSIIGHGAMSMAQSPSHTTRALGATSTAYTRTYSTTTRTKSSSSQTLARHHIKSNLDSNASPLTSNVVQDHTHQRRSPPTEIDRLIEHHHAINFNRLTTQAAIQYHLDPIRQKMRMGLGATTFAAATTALVKENETSSDSSLKVDIDTNALHTDTTTRALLADGDTKALSTDIDLDMSPFKLAKPLVPTPPPVPTVTDETLEQFIPPQPSRIIPVIHDGMDWDEPNFLIRPFVTVIDYLHDLTNWPWYISIVTWAWILRSAISPLTYKQQSSAVKFTLLQPDLLNINKELRALQPGSPQYKEKQKEVVELYRKHGVSPFTSVFWSLSSMPFYVCSFLAIRNMANSPFFASEFATGGFFPYINLSASAGWELATLNAVVNLIMMHVTQPVPFHKMQKLQKIMFMMSHAMIICFIPILSNINTASIFYFVANNSFSIFFQKFFYTNWFRKKVGLPTVAEVNAIRELIQKKAADPLGTKDALPEGANKNAFVLGQEQQLSSRDIIQQAKEQLHRASGGIISQPTNVPENLKNVNAFTVDPNATPTQQVFGNDPTAPKPLKVKSPRRQKSKHYVKH